MDIQFNVPYGLAENVITAEAYKLGFRDVIGTAFVEPVHYDRFFGNAYNPYIDQAHRGIAKVSDSNQMDIKLSLIQPPVLEIVESALKDTYTRQAKPTLNYGSSQTLVAGQAADGTYNTFIEIDIADIAELLTTDMNVLSIKFLIGKQATTNGTIKIYECYTTWHENYLMWINSTSLSTQPVFTQQVTGSQVEIDVVDYIRELVVKGITKFNIVIKSDDFILLNSKESGTSPRVIARYTDPSWTGYTSESFLAGHATIVAGQYKDFYNSYRLREKSYLSGYALKRDPSLVESAVWKNRPFMTGIAETVVSSYTTGSAFIKARSDLQGSGFKNTSLGNSSANILARRDMFGIAIIPPDQGTDDKNGSAYVLRYNWISYAEKVFSNYTFNSVVIRRLDNSDESGKGYINPSLRGKATLRLHDDHLIGSVIVRDSFKEDKSSKAYLDKPWVYSKYSLRKSVDMVSTAFKRAYIPKDIASRAEAQKAWLPGHYSLRVNNNITGTADLTQASWNYASAVIRQFGDKDFKDRATVRRGDIKDTIGSIDVASSYFGLYGNGIIRRSDYKDIKAYVTRRRSDVTGNYGSAQIARTRNIYGEANVYQNRSLVSSVYLRQFDASYSYWQAFVANGFYRSHKVSSAFIQAKWSHFSCGATVKTGARWWRPNYEGELDYEDRKLPRVWIRSNFIPK
jgi:hypothetical protein